MKWWFDDGNSIALMSAQEGAGPFSWHCRGAAPTLLLAGVLSALTSCSKISLPQTAQDEATPASSPAGSQTVFSFLPSGSNPPTQINVAPPSATPAAMPLPTTAGPTAGTAQAQPVAFKVHPAMGAKEAAIKLYPQLAVKDSTFNKVFRDLYTEEMQRNPDLLTRADWPLTLAHHTADLLSQPAVPAAPPAQTSLRPGAPEMAQTQPAQPTRATPTPATALSRGAYNKTRSPYWWYGPWVRYY